MPGILNVASTTRTLGSSRCSASHSVETSGSVVDIVQILSGARHGRACPGHPRSRLAAAKDVAARDKPWHDGERALLLFRLPLLDRAAGIAPGGKTAAHMGDRLQAHVLRGLGRECRTQPAGAVEDEFLVLLEDRLGIGALRIDPEFQHAARAGERAGDLALALDLAGVADIDDHHVRVLRGLDGVSGADGLDRRVGLVDQGFDAAVNGLGHFALLEVSWPSFRGDAKASNPESRDSGSGPPDHPGMTAN